MMDYYGQFPAPPKDKVIEYIVSKLEDTFSVYGISAQDIECVAKTEYDKFGPLGSQAGWMVITNTLLIENVKNALNVKFQFMIGNFS